MEIVAIPVVNAGMQDKIVGSLLIPEYMSRQLAAFGVEICNPALLHLVIDSKSGTPELKEVRIGWSPQTPTGG